MEIHFCKNHSEKIAHYRCYQCKKSICSDCRQTLEHHYFCSYPCYLRYKILQTLGKLKSRKLALLGVSQMVLLIIIIAQAVYFQNRIDRIGDTAFTSTKRDTMVFPALKNYVTNYNSAYRQQHVNAIKLQERNYYELDLNLERDWVVNIWKNNQAVLSEAATQKERRTFSLPLAYGKNKFKILVLDRDQKPVHRNEFHVEYRKPTTELLRRSIERGNREFKKLAFTFDGGSDDAHTEEILAILKEHDLQCTLFLTGKFMQNHPNLVKEMLKNGHEIGNHTYNHPHLTTYAQNRKHNTLSNVNKKFLQDQLLETDSIFYNLTQQHLKPYWRAPFGEYNKEILTWAAEAGYLHIRWTNGFDTFDWVTDASSKLYRTPEEIYNHIMKRETKHPKGLNGVIVLMHLGSHRNNDHVFEALPQLINNIRERGYQLSSVTSLLQP